ncbi:MAG: lipoyl(octanoyl) transferase LipB, partial [Candidatus Zixiibacteriota bacterium]
MDIHHLGLIPYDAAYRLQRDLWAQRVAGDIPDQLLLLEHPPVITLGRNTRAEHLLLSADLLAQRGIQVVEADRGGDVTYHGPGQLVGYPVINLQPDRMDVLRYLRDLEEALIRTLAQFGLEGGRRPGYTGVWVDDRKIASIGVKISRWVTYHGFALNVAPDLSAFDLIVPCGLSGVRMTSLARELGRDPGLEPVARVAAA